jgi:hypothetical protein
MLLAVLAVVFVVSTACASEHQAAVGQNRSADNPLSPLHRASKAALEHAVESLIANAAAHAATEDEAAQGATSSWFSQPVPYVEASFADNRDRRTNGLDSDVTGLMAGVDFVSLYDVSAGLMFNYSYWHGDASPSISNELNSYTGTIFGSKAIDWLFVGASLSYELSGAETDQAGVNTDTDAKSYAVAPFAGVSPYNEGAISTYSAVMPVIRAQDFDYSRGIQSDDSSDVTLVVMNRISYAFSEELVGTGILDYNQIVAEELTEAAQDGTDDEWITIGAKMTYSLDEDSAVYGSVTTEVWNSSYENYLFTVGYTRAL